MSISQDRAQHLVDHYNHSLEQQIAEHGSSLACSDEDLWKQVQAQLSEEDAQEAHCLGLDPLSVMEESLEADAALMATPRQVRATGGLRGLAKAFKILEQVALNLYLGPWREEYKVVKMYSGIFTHYIKPALSMPQIEKLFGMLGYQPCLTQYEQFQLQSHGVSTNSQDKLLRSSCAFFLARCECCLLLAALGSHCGEVRWELSLVRERLRGHTLQVALDNMKRALEDKPHPMEPFDGGAAVDLYLDEQVNERQRDMVTNYHDSPHSLQWQNPNSASLPTKKHSNGMLPDSSASPLSTREQVCISTFRCQLDSNRTGSPAVDSSHSRHPSEEATIDKVDPNFHRLLRVAALLQNETEITHFCSCLQAPNQCLKQCIQCNNLHNTTCTLLQHCLQVGHDVLLPEEMEKLAASLPQNDGLKTGALQKSSTVTSSNTAVPSFSAFNNPKSMSSVCDPITYHNCCNLSQLDPQLMCIDCRVFHSAPCTAMELCQAKHTVKGLGTCSCGRACSRKPLVLCRYCGNEFCNNCWYRDPLTCICGQNFDLSSPV